jgi:hypothetical protein
VNLEFSPDNPLQSRVLHRKIDRLLRVVRIPRRDGRRIRGRRNKRACPVLLGGKLDRAR